VIKREGMLVKRKGSRKRRCRFYEAFEFVYGESSLREVSSFLGDLGKLVDTREGAWIVTKDGRRIGTGQFLLEDDRHGKILRFDPTIFYDWFDIWQNIE
jgi:hypothetical protein